MKKLLLSILFALLFSTLFTANAQTPACGGTFTDPAGPNANYANSSDYTVTICPTNPGDVVTVTFTAFDTETNWDALYVFNGTSTAAPQLASANPAANVPGGLAGGYWGTTIPGPFTSSDPSGCLTFRFRSDNTINRAGWIANVTCAPMDQCPSPSVLTTTSITSNSVVLGWQNTLNAQSWQYIVLPCGSPAPTAASTGWVPAPTNPVTVPGLNPATCYSIYVRALCGTISGNSVWSTPVTVTTAQAPPACGGTFADAAGPNANYANSSDSTVTICPTNPGEQVTVTFTSFDTEATWDALYVFNGNSITSPQIASNNPASNVPGGLAGGFWGTIIPGPFTSSAANGCLTFRFRSDASVNRPGWIANVTCAPPPTCPAPTQLVATNITSDSVTLGWTSNGTATLWHVLALPCGSPAPTAATTGWQTATVNPFVVAPLTSATCYNFYVRSVCNNGADIGPWSPFITATTLTAPPVCGGNFIDAGGPTANYPNNSDSTVTICPSIPGQIVTVTFTAFNTEATWDALYVFDGNSIASPQIASTNPAANVPGGLAGGFWGTVIPGPFTSTDASGCLTFRFRSDGTINNPGWIANITCSPPPTCPKPTALVTTNVTINSVTLGWTNNSSATLFEVVALPCGSQPTASTAGTQTSLNPFTISGLDPSTCYTLFVRAICTADTDLSLWSAGWNITTQAIPPVCGGNYIDNGGLNANYLNNSDSSVTICPTVPGDVVTVTFTSFNVEATWDALYVYDGNSLSSPQITSSNPTGNVPGGVSGGYWGNVIPGPFTSTDPSGCLTFRFRSDNTVNNPGWNASVTCAPAVDKLQLVAFVDQNNNGIKDGNESFYSNGSFVYQQNNAGPNTLAYSPTGRYDLFDNNPTNTYDITYQVQAEFAPYYSSGTTSYNDVSVAMGSGTNVLYFPITLTQSYNDVTVTLVPMSPPRPGLTYINRIMYKNLGVTAASGTITFTKPTPVAITNITQTGTLNTANGFTYAFTNLQPNETRFFNVTMSVPSSPIVVVNQILNASASITAPSNDINLNNNSSNLSQIVVNSYDPNDKMEAHGDEIPFSQFAPTDYLFYTIRFQNMGTANAIDVHVEDVLDPLLDETSIRMVSSSHNYTMDRINNTIFWDFRNIQLVPSSANQNMSVGYIHFKIKMKPGFVEGDLVSNNASIFFDSNPAIVTNTWDTKFVTLLGTVDNVVGNFIMYPNPANNVIYIGMQNTTDTIESVSITDVLGKTITTVKGLNVAETSMDVSNLSKGMYLVEITTTNQSKSTKKLMIN